VLSDTLTELDLYDNAIGHINGVEKLTKLTSLDLSFNGIKHIKRLEPLKDLLQNLYFVQNRISRIEGLNGFSRLTNLELGANRIREIEGLESLVSLEQLWLGKNKITELKVCSCTSRTGWDGSADAGRISEPSPNSRSYRSNPTDSRRSKPSKT